MQDPGHYKGELTPENGYLSATTSSVHIRPIILGYIRCYAFWLRPHLS